MGYGCVRVCVCVYVCVCVNMCRACGWVKTLFHPSRGDIHICTSLLTCIYVRQKRPIHILRVCMRACVCVCVCVCV